MTSAIADEREVSAIEIKRLRDALKTLVDDCLQYDAWARPVYAVEKAQHVLSGKE